MSLGLTTKNLSENIKYGFGKTIGFTSDGLVFIVCDTEGPDGQPMLTQFLETPSRAEEIAESLIKAATEARKRGILQVG